MPLEDGFEYIFSHSGRTVRCKNNKINRGLRLTDCKPISQKTSSAKGSVRVPSNSNIHEMVKLESVESLPVMCDLQTFIKVQNDTSIDLILFTMSTTPLLFHYRLDLRLDSATLQLTLLIVWRLTKILIYMMHKLSSYRVTL